MPRTSTAFTRSPYRVHLPKRVGRRASRWISTLRETPAYFRDEQGALWLSLPLSIAFIGCSAAIAGGLMELAIALICWSVPI